MDAQLLMGALSSFARTLTAEYGISDVLYDLTENLTEVLKLSGAGVSLREDDRLQFVTASSAAIGELERIQDAHQAGVCVDAAVSGAPVVVPDLYAPEVQRRWPEYCTQAMETGVRAVAGVPMMAGSTPIGALDLYSDDVRAWTDEDLKVAGVLADMATGYVVHASHLAQQRELAGQLQRALESRVVIEQAKGVLANAYGTSVDEAFQRIRRHARDHNAHIHDVASAVVQLGLRP